MQLVVRPEGHWPGMIKGLGLSSFAGILSSSMVGLLVWMGAVSFRKVLQADKGKMAYVMQVISPTWTTHLSNRYM